MRFMQVAQLTDGVALSLEEPNYVQRLRGYERKLTWLKEFEAESGSGRICEGMVA